MPSKPLSHFLVRPSPLKGMGIELVVLWPSGVDMVDERLSVGPGNALQVPVAEGGVERFALVEPGSMGRSETRSPPPMSSEIFGVGGSSMARIAALNQKYAAPVVVAPTKLLQGRDVMRSVFGFWAEGLHLSGGHDQKQQDIDGAVAGVLELLLLDRAGDGAPNRLTLKGLEIGHVVGADNQKPLLLPSVGVGVASQDLLCPLFETHIDASGLPVAGAMGLQINLMQDAPHRAGIDTWDDAVSHGLAGQLPAAQVGNVQPFGDRFQTGQLHDLRSGQRGRFRPGGQCRELPPIPGQVSPVRSDGKSAAPSRIASHLCRDGLHAFAFGHRQYDPRPLNPKPRQATATRNSLQNVPVILGKHDPTPPSTSHGPHL